MRLNASPALKVQPVPPVRSERSERHGITKVLTSSAQHRQGAITTRGGAQMTYHVAATRAEAQAIQDYLADQGKPTKAVLLGDGWLLLAAQAALRLERYTK